MIDPQRTAKIPDWLEQAWLQRYLDRELSAAENEWFEAYAIDKAALVQAIESDNALRDAMHAWHAQEQLNGASSLPASVAETPPVAYLAAAPVRRRRASPRWSQPLAAAASLAVAAVFGAGVSQWLAPASIDGAASVNSPRRVVFDSLRGSNSTAPHVEPARKTADPLLLDIAVPAQAEAVIAHFADGSTLPLVVSGDGFVSLLGSPDELRRLSPIRLAYTVNGVASERPLDLSNALETQAR